MGDSDSVVVLARLKKRSAEADEMIRILRTQLSQMKKVSATKSVAEQVSRLKVENRNLEMQVEELLARLVSLEKQNGVPQIPIHENVTISCIPEATTNKQPLPAQQVEVVIKTPTEEKKAAKKQDKKGSNPKSTAEDGKPQDDREADVGRLDLRVGLIVNAKKHPDADSLYVEEVDVGEGENRTVVSGLVKHVKVEDMQNRLAVLLCNLKPAKMRGVTSEAMVMCASTPEKVEILNPPAGAVPGDRVVCEGFVGEPDKELNPKKKIFEKVAPDLKTDANRVATYKGVPWCVPSKGVVMAPTLTNVQIK